MKKRLCARKIYLLLLLFALLSLQLATGSVAAAQATHVELSLPGEGKVGEESAVDALLVDVGGSPIEGVEVVFYTPAEFANVSGEIEIGQAVTGEKGIASVAYMPRSWGEQTIIARFAGNSQYAPSETSATILIEPGPQLYAEEAGVSVPGIGVWVLAAALGAVWTIFFIVALLLGLIAQIGEGRFPYQDYREVD
jgi:hypothetical protein